MKTNVLEAAVLDLYYLNIPMAGLGDGPGVLGSAAPGSVYWSLHLSYPGEGGTQATNETAYPSYSRKPLARSSVDFVRSGPVIQNVLQQQFPTCSGASTDVLYYLGVGRSASGAGTLDRIVPIGTLLGEGVAVPGTDVVTIAGLAGVAVNDPVGFFTLPAFDTMPGGLTEGTVYYVKTVSGADITVSATPGGATIDITSQVATRVWKFSPITMQLNAVPTFAAGAFTDREH